MKTKDLIELGIAEDVAEKILVIHGKDIEAHKGKLATVENERDALKTQLSEASNQIESFKGMNIDQIKASADDYKAKFEQATADTAAQILKIKQEHALERELKDTYKVKDLVAVKAHLKADALKFNDKDESFLGLKEQLDPLKETYGAYFSDFVEPPKITTGGNNQNINIDAVTAAMRNAAGLKS